MEQLRHSLPRHNTKGMGSKFVSRSRLTFTPHYQAGKYLEFDDRDEYVGFHDEEADCLICDAGSYSFSNSSSCHDWYVW